ncbi:uncharacterized protein Z518_07040 [Rhinocladiella mackenziei CBS 650.93]|uniref:NAD binding Rossmann fold oxidoreductase n=1 Tax=Rhinocladiella mackenziei CBS 650.93 TaxID=1442369 RepID=A0A0D2FN67_9EURO|nr:uncharacterized protein Z518_07040 [Rhinocladiella mackenziei CBS 650.93]KIX03487.1 hypothetical protein Z518_07040 [Rhinocladiella mackenziei CBS 650.93]
MARSPLNVAVIGYGLSAQVFQIPFIANVPMLNLYAIVQRQPMPHNDAGKEHPGVKIYRSTSDLLQDAEVDLVVVATASHTHFDVFLCEKPFTMTVKQADELIALAHERRCLLTVFHNRRWDSDFLTLSSLIQNDVLGRIVEFESHFDVHSPSVRAGWKATWRTETATGSGVLYDLGAHLIDQALVLFGKPRKVTAFLYHQRTGDAKYGDPDSMTVLLHYMDGKLATLKASVINPTDKQLRYWVRGEKGTFRKYHLDVQESQIVNERRMPGSPGFGIEPSSHHGTLTTAPVNGNIISQPLPTLAGPTYESLYKTLVEALHGNGDVPVSPESARDVIHVIELAIQSAAQEKTLSL